MTIMSIIKSFEPVYIRANSGYIFAGIKFTNGEKKHQVYRIDHLRLEGTCKVCKKTGKLSKIHTVPRIDANMWCNECMQWLQNINEYYIRPRPMLNELSPIEYINPECRRRIFAGQIGIIMGQLRRFLPPELARAIAWLLVQLCLPNEPFVCNIH